MEVYIVYNENGGFKMRQNDKWFTSLRLTVILTSNTIGDVRTIV